MTSSPNTTSSKRRFGASLAGDSVAVAIELGNDSRDSVDLRLGDRREDRQRAALAREPLGNRAAAGDEAEVRVRGLEMDRTRIVDRVGDPGVVEVVSERVSHRRADDEEMEYVVTVGGGRCGWSDRGVDQRLAECRPGRPTGAVGVVEAIELDSKDRRLEGIEAIGLRRELVVVAGQLAVGSQFPHPIGELR